MDMHSNNVSNLLIFQVDYLHIKCIFLKFCALYKFLRNGRRLSYLCPKREIKEICAQGAKKKANSL